MLIPGQHWYAVKDGDPRAVALYCRHYSRDTKKSSEQYRGFGFSGPGEAMMLMTPGGDALWLWRTRLDRHTGEYDAAAKRGYDDGQRGVMCAVFRNESAVLSSELVAEADELAWRRWPGERHFTYVDPTKTRRKRDPGRCFRKAGWTPCGVSKGGLVLLERLPAALAEAA